MVAHNQANFDTLITVWNNTCATPSCVGAGDDSVVCGITTGLVLDLLPGRYYVMVHGYFGAAGTFTLSVGCGMLTCT